MFREQLRDYRNAEDATRFVALCRKVKATAIEMIQRDMHVDAGLLFTSYNKSFQDLADCSPEFLLAIIDVLPQNSRNTFQLLGKSNALDQAIISKFDLDSLFISKEHGFSYLLTWAIQNNDLYLVEKTVLHLTQIGLELPPDNGTRHDLANEIVNALLGNEQHLPALPPSVDQAISSLISVNGFCTRQPAYVEWMAITGLHETLMKMLVHELMAECPLIQYSKERSSKILAALPQSPTLVQLRAIHHFLKPKGLSEQILFDESVDLDGYLAVMRSTRYLKPDRDDLTFHGIRPFSVCMTEENLNIPARRKKIAKLLNTTYEAYVAKGYVSGEDVLTSLVENHVPKRAIKLIDAMKGQALEDALGL